MKQKKQKKTKEISHTEAADWDYHDNDPVDHLVFDRKYKIICATIWSIYLIVLLCLSLLPGEFVNNGNVGILGKILHLGFYVGLFITTLICFAVLGFRDPVSSSIFFGICIAIGTEVLQYFIPGRTGTFGDVCINLTGLFVLPILYLVIYEKLNSMGYVEENEY